MNVAVKYLYEFIGTFFLVLTVGMTVLNPGSIGLFAPIAIGSVLALMIYAGGHISGGHYNPAVSLAVALRGKLDKQDLLFYWLAQLVAGAVAAFTVLYLKGPGAAAPLAHFDSIRALIAEFLFTFALCYVVLNVATARETENNSYFGWAIGFTVLVGAYAVGTISGGAFNPAVALGVTLMHLSAWENLWIFIVANLLGAVVAALVFNYAHPYVKDYLYPYAKKDDKV
jgi:aquaporin Z